MGNSAVKRRRVINVNVSLIQALKERAAERGISPTKIATNIAIGKEPPVKPKKKSTTAKSVSMTEALWLSIRQRGENMGKSGRGAMWGILTGRDPILTQEEIDFGRARAAERERLRAMGTPEESTPPRREEIHQPPPDSKSIAASPEPPEEPEPKELPHVKLSKGVPEDPKLYEKRGAKNISSNQDFYGGVFQI